MYIYWYENIHSKDDSITFNEWYDKFGDTDWMKMIQKMIHKNSDQN